LLNDTFLGANSLIQTMLPALFSHSTHFVATMTRRIRHAIDLVLDYARSIPALDARPPDGGYYLFPAVHGWDDEEELVLHLLEHGVLVHPGYFYGDVAGTHIMISALTYPEHLAQGMERLGKALNR
jgi:aspartate/methionine/tyrosine aminotransferase